MAFRRRYGHPSDRRVLDGLPLAGRDYSWAKSPADADAEVPDRAGFGLPLAFRFRNGPESSVVWASDNRAGRPEEARRASPLLLHVTKFVPGAFCPVLTYLPARLIPDGRRLRLAERKGPGKTSPSGPTDGQCEIVKRFLDDLAAKRLVREVQP